MDLVPFRIDVPAADVADLEARLRATRWPEPATVDDWSQGVPLDYVQDLCRYWADSYDWPARQAWLNLFDQYRTELDGLPIHFLHVRSPQQDALPLVLTHGWPGSIVEFMDVLGSLTDPVAHGGDPADAFHAVVPSLPGYGWSGKPSRPGWGVQRIADAWAELMSRLGYQQFGAQGGDWGSPVTTHLGARHAQRVLGIHLNMVYAEPPAGQTAFTEREQTALAAQRRYRRADSGYARLQGTRPQTLGYGLADSPAGQCAWILEKFWAWSDCAGDPVGVFGADRILDNVSTYWFSSSAASSARLYWESSRTSYLGAETVSVPTGVSLFPKDIYLPTREWASARYTDLRMWHEFDRGGHFAAFEQPEIFIDEVREFFRPLR